jgi:hypothetical protein
MTSARLPETQEAGAESLAAFFSHGKNSERGKAVCISREGHLMMLINTFETKSEQRSLIGAWLRFVWIG